MSGDLGFDFYLGPKVEAPERIDFTLPAVEVLRRRVLWSNAILEAVRYEDAWALLTTKPNGDVLLFDTSPDRIDQATSWGGWVHLLLAREAPSRKPRPEDDEPCTEPCDHCRPEALRGCVLDAGHRGYHSCRPTA